MSNKKVDPKKNKTKPLTPEIVSDPLPPAKDSKLTKQKAGISKQEPLQKGVRKWTEYSQQLEELDLTANQIKAIKVFIEQEINSQKHWADLTGVSDSSISDWIKHDSVFRQAIADACRLYARAGFPFGVQKMVDKAKAGDLHALNILLKFLGEDTPREQRGDKEWMKLTAEWMKKGK